MGTVRIGTGLASKGITGYSDDDLIEVANTLRIGESFWLATAAEPADDDTPAVGEGLVWVPAGTPVVLEFDGTRPTIPGIDPLGVEKPADVD